MGFSVPKPPFDLKDFLSQTGKPKQTRFRRLPLPSTDEEPAEREAESPAATAPEAAG